MHMHISSPSTTYSYDPSKVRSPSHYSPSHVLSPGPSSHGPQTPSVVQSPYVVAQPHYTPTLRAPQLGSVPLPTENARNGMSPYQSHGSGGSLTLNPALVYNPVGVLLFNLMYPTENIRFKKSASTQLGEVAIHPQQRSLRLRLCNPNLQIDFSFTAENPNGLTLYDVLHRIYTWFQSTISRQEMSAYSSQQRAYLTDAFTRRTANNPNEYHAGLKRLDWLGRDTFFLGLSPAPDGSGMWLIKLGSQPMA